MTPLAPGRQTAGDWTGVLLASSSPSTLQDWFHLSDSTRSPRLFAGLLTMRMMCPAIVSPVPGSLPVGQRERSSVFPSFRQIPTIGVKDWKLRKSN